jgi:hypothetical protein
VNLDIDGGFSAALATRVAEFLAQRGWDPDRDSELPEGAAQSLDVDAEVGEAEEDEDTSRMEEEEAGEMAGTVE